MIRVSVDVGGTFTDLVAFNEETGGIINIKTPSVPKSPEKGVIHALKQFLSEHEPSSVSMIGHATTIATNTLLGQVDLEVPETALITTLGFKDVIEIGRQRRAEVYNLFFQRPPQLVERRHRYEVVERVNTAGIVETQLDPAELEGLVNKLKKTNVASVAVGFINSYANPVHESMVMDALSKSLPDVYLTASHMISNEYREYERLSTAVVNAVLMPVMHTYITNLDRNLNELGLTAPLYVMQSNGGMAKSNIIASKPATVVESGPAAGVIASAWLGEQTGIRDIISFDMGGTTAKAGTVRGRIPEVVPEYEVAGTIHMGRLVKGSGYPVRFPFIDLAECSAGGGTIAKVVNGSLQVGPVSAGAEPGPACYGQGGKDATITDANLMLGRLNQESLLSGDMEIHPELAKKAYKVLAESLGVSPEEAAMSAIRIANSMMSKILRIVSVERGYDPRGFSLVAFGGAGPMHVCALAEELEINHIIVPPNPGMFSALGLLTADLFHDYTSPVIMETNEVDPGKLEDMFSSMEETGRATLMKEGIHPDQHRFQRTLDIRYSGQGFELNVETGNPVTPASLSESLIAFHEKHREVYGYAAEDEPLEVVNAKLRVIGLLDKPSLKENKERIGDTEMETRRVYFESTGWVDAEVYQRGSLDGVHVGPAIVEQYDSTTVIYPGWSYVPDRLGNLILRRVAQ
ncbi:MAG: hydantoinase/oxoprolinase family protein [Candidatus Bathyarchaeota archaeon]|nr:hydantoinase/oxoprolinase family protein [Candidatus Bathyarchaeota archaeon]